MATDNSLKDVAPTTLQWEERKFNEESGQIRWDSGLTLDTGFYWDQIIGTDWDERSFKEAQSEFKYRTWTTRR